VLYVQDVHTAQGAAVWKGVFLADISDPGNPSITLAHEGIVVPRGRIALHLHLIDGSTHETDPKSPTITKSPLSSKLTSPSNCPLRKTNPTNKSQLA